MKKLITIVLSSLVLFSTSNIFAKKIAKEFLIDRKPPVVYKDSKSKLYKVPTNVKDRFPFETLDNWGHKNQPYRLYYIPVTEKSKDYVVISYNNFPYDMDYSKYPTEYKVTSWFMDNISKFLLTLQKDSNTYYKISDVVIIDPGFAKKYELYFKVKDLGEKLEKDNSMLYLSGTHADLD